MQPSPSMSASSTNASHSIKLLVVDATIPIYVRLINQRVTFLLRHLLAQVHHDMAQLHPVDEPVPIPVKDFESLPDLILCLLIAQLLGHHIEEGGEGDHPTSVLIHFVDHIL